jgi:hypothetical protein
VTSADAQAFKRACSCFGLGRYFYDVSAIWVDLDQNRQPAKTPVLSAWALPEYWRKSIRPPGKNGNSSANGPQYSSRPDSTSGKPSQTAASQTRQANGANGHAQPERTDGPTAKGTSADLDARILALEKTVGAALYRSILRDYGRVSQPKLIRDAAVKRKVLQIPESATRGLSRLEAVTKPLDARTVKALLAKLQAPPLHEIADLKTLQQVVLGLEELTDQN